MTKKTNTKQVQQRISTEETDSKDLSLECRRQSLMLHDDPQEADILNWLEAAADTKDWE